MPDTPTPRAVLAQALHLAQERCSEYITVAPDPDSEEVRELERDYLAALAASAGPITAEFIEKMRTRFVSLRLWGDVHELCDAYTALAAECAALRATVADVRMANTSLMASLAKEECVTTEAALHRIKGTLGALQSLDRILARTPTPEAS